MKNIKILLQFAFLLHFSGHVSDALKTMDLIEGISAYISERKGFLIEEVVGWMEDGSGR